MNEGGQGVEYAATLAPKASGGIMCLSIMDTAANLVLDGGNVTLTPPGVVLTQYDAQGNFQSYTQYPISSKINEFSIYLGCVLTGDGTDFYMSALYSAPQVVLGTTTLTNAGGASGTTDAVLAKIDTTGAVLWAMNIGSDEEEEVFSLDYSSSNGLTLGGSTSSSELVLRNDTVVNAGFLTNEAFVANLRYSGIGLTEYHTRKAINAYPNPTSGVLHFNLEEGQQNSVQIQVQNMLGQTVLNESFNTISGAGSLDVDFLAPGVYLLNIMDGNKLYTGKFIKE
jgi:hypothetical protein